MYVKMCSLFEFCKTKNSACHCGIFNDARGARDSIHPIQNTQN